MNQFIKLTYFTALLLGGWFLAELLLDGTFWMNAEGMVLAEPSTIAAEHFLTVQKLTVREGDEVKEGQIVAYSTSQEIANARAHLESEAALRNLKLAEFQLRVNVATALLEPAERRKRTAVEGRDELEKIYAKGFLPILTRTAAAEQAFAGERAATEYKADATTLLVTLPGLTRSIESATEALKHLETLYDDGKLRAPADGTISLLFVKKGSVIRPGDPIAEIVGTHRFVVAWFPVARWYKMRVGQTVSISTGTGQAALSGHITKIGDVAGALPKEFQKSFAPIERQQMIWIEFDKDNAPLPYFTKVTVTR